MQDTDCKYMFQVNEMADNLIQRVSRMIRYYCEKEKHIDDVLPSIELSLRSTVLATEDRFISRPSMGWPCANIRINFTHQKLECLFDLIRKTARSYLHSSGQNTALWRTDGRTDRQTDRQICRNYYGCLHCRQCERALKIQMVFITALHGTQTRSSDDNSVCLSVRLSVRQSVCQTRDLWQNWRKICPDFYTIRKII